MVTPNMTQDRPRTRTKLQQPPFSPFPPLEISSGSGLVLQNLFGAMCKSLDVTISVPGSLSGLHFTPWRCWSAADDCDRSVEVMYYYYYHLYYVLFCIHAYISLCIFFVYMYVYLCALFVRVVYMHVHYIAVHFFCIHACIVRVFCIHVCISRFFSLDKCSQVYFFSMSRIRDFL